MSCSIHTDFVPLPRESLGVSRALLRGGSDSGCRRIGAGVDGAGGRSVLSLSKAGVLVRENEAGSNGKLWRLRCTSDSSMPRLAGRGILALRAVGDFAGC